VAFETIRGESGVDFVGTAAVDALFALNETGAITADGLAGNDTINIANSTGLVGNATVKGGAGNDTIAFTDAAGANVSRLLNSSVNGGAGDDAIGTEGTESSVVRGNEADDNFTLRGNYSNSTINGNSGEDSFAINIVGNATATLTLSNSKILGGTDNDGRMRFNAGGGIAAAIDSTINGSKGNDQITIGAVARAEGFTVFGGQGNDLINSSNAGADGIVYSGDKGDDQITTGAANDVVNGGEDNDLIDAGTGTDTIDAGTGDDIVLDRAGNDTSVLGEGNDAYTDAAGNDTITGGAGRDTYTIDATGDNNYVIGSGDSAATLTGTSQGFDIFSAGFTADNQHIDLTPVAEALLGDAVTGGTQVQTANRLATGAAGSTATFGYTTAASTILGGVTPTVFESTGLETQADVAVTQIATFVGNATTAAVANGLAVGVTGFFDATPGSASEGFLIGTVAANGTFTQTAGANYKIIATNADITADIAGGTVVSNATSTVEVSAITASTASSFAALRTQFANGGLTNSGGDNGNFINYNVVQVAGNVGAAAGMNGTYIIVNNTNNILDSGDVMFEVAGGAAADINQFGIFSSTTNASAFII
jgi:Ca2+-binding RTX toxin-like protein